MDLAQDLSLKTRIIQFGKEEYSLYMQFSNTVLKQFVYCLTLRMVALGPKMYGDYIFDKLFV